MTKGDVPKLSLYISSVYEETDFKTPYSLYVIVMEALCSCYPDTDRINLAHEESNF